MARNYCEDERVISAFLNNFRMVDVIKETGLSKNTVYKIRKNPDFQRVIRERKSAILRTAVNKMQSTLVRDFDVLQSIIDDPDTPKQVRVNAISTKWNQFREWSTTVDVLRRLDALENNTSGDSLETF